MKLVAVSERLRIRQSVCAPPAGRNLLLDSFSYTFSPKANALDHAFLLGVEHKLEAAVEAELLVDIVEMHFDGAFRDAEPIADGAVPQSFSHHLHDLDFPRRQRLRHFALRLFASDDGLKRAGDGFLIDPALAAVHAPHTLQQRLRGACL